MEQFQPTATKRELKGENDGVVVPVADLEPVDHLGHLDLIFLGKILQVPLHALVHLCFPFDPPLGSFLGFFWVGGAPEVLPVRSFLPSWSPDPPLATSESG